MSVPPKAGGCTGAPESAKFITEQSETDGLAALEKLNRAHMAERGAEVRWVTEPWRMETWEPLIDEHTRFLYVEMPSNPQQAFADLEAVAELAHAHGIPLIVDSTIATPATTSHFASTSRATLRTIWPKL